VSEFFHDEMRMDAITHPDLHYLNAAIGWLELGDLDSAEEELRHVDKRFAKHPCTLDIRWQLHAKRDEWTEAESVGEQLIDIAPELPSGWIHRAYALHEMKETEQALSILEPAAETFPDNGLIRYNLACYYCRLGRPSEALDWIRKAARAHGVKKTLDMAVEDPDLEPLIGEIKRALRKKSK
jgi:tetratricopeptide (TPR) repeat protein